MNKPHDNLWDDKTRLLYTALLQVQSDLTSQSISNTTVIKYDIVRIHISVSKPIESVIVL